MLLTPQKTVFSHIAIFSYKEFRNPDDPIALGGFRLRDDILSLEPLIGYIDRRRGALEVEILCCQHQQLAHADAASEQHFPVRLLAHVSSDFSGILLQTVILLRVVEDRTELAVDGLEIGRRIELPVLLSDAHERVLPGDHVTRLDLAERPILETGRNLGVDHVVLGFPGVH